MSCQFVDDLAEESKIAYKPANIELNYLTSRLKHYRLKKVIKTSLSSCFVILFVQLLQVLIIRFYTSNE